MLSIPFYTFPFEVRARCLCARLCGCGLNIKTERTMFCVFGSVHLNGNQAPIVRAVLLVACGTSGREKEYQCERYF